MTIYFIMLAITSLFAVLSAHSAKRSVVSLQKQAMVFSVYPQKLFYFLAFMPLFFISALRYRVGVDYNPYVWIFNALTQTGENTHVEQGYALLNKVWGFFSTDATGVFAIATAVVLLFFGLSFYERSAYPALSVYLFVTLGYFFYSMISVRHFMALSIFFFASRYMKEPSGKSFFKFLILILLAASFHKIALIGIPIYFVFTRKFSLRYFSIFAILLVICAIFNKQLMNIIFTFVYSSYKGSAYNVYDFSIFNVLLSGIAVFFSIAYYEPLLKRCKGNIVYINAAFFMLLFYLTCWWIPTPTRIGHFGTIFFLLLFPEVLACEPRKSVRRLYTVMFIVFGVLFMMVMLDGARGPSMALLPYQTIFSR